MGVLQNIMYLHVILNIMLQLQVQSDSQYT
jgi:hypothetical protein